MKKFYFEFKEIIETSAFLLIITGFFLNLPKQNGLTEKSLSQIKFF